MSAKPHPYAECPECGSAAVTLPDPSAGRALYVYRRCGHRARSFARQAFDPDRFDGRPRLAGRLMPTCREIDE